MENSLNVKENNSEIGTVRMALRDGSPIGIGYFAVSFAFGIFATGTGLGVLEALFISMFNLTSAGQIAAVPIIAASGSFIELALTQLVINARYLLMSISMSQSLGKSVKMADKFVIAFSLTDEMYAVSTSKGGMLSRKYLYSLIILPYLGWTMGTLFGALAGNILPKSVVSALGIAIYGMFIAIVVPAMKQSRMVTLSVFIAIALSLSFKYAPFLNKVPSGFSIIICAVVSSLIAATIDVSKKRQRGNR